MRRAPRPTECATGRVCSNVDLDAATRDLRRQYLRACTFDGSRYFLFRARLDDKDDTAAASGAAGLCSDGPGAPRGFDELVDQRRRNTGGVLFARRPFFPYKAARFGPVIPLHGLPDGVCETG